MLSSPEGEVATTPDESWDYTAVPAAAWTFTGANVQGDDEIAVAARPEGLAWTGECFNRNWGGPYTIGFQSYEEFLERGPLVGRTPPEVRDGIRDHILRHRRTGPATRLDVVARIAAPQPVPLHQISLVLDEQQLQIFSGPELAGRTEIAIYRGTVGGGDHVLRGAVAWDPPRKGNIAYFDYPFAAARGETTRVCVDVSHLLVACRTEKVGRLE